MAFPGEKPPLADELKHPVPVVNPIYPVPGTFLPKQFVLQYKVGDAYVETATADMLVPDLRFSEAVKLIADVKTPGKTKLSASGVFRYSDRKPCWQAQWEDIIALREKLVPTERRPMEFEVRVGGKTVGKLLPTKTEQKRCLWNSHRLRQALSRRPWSRRSYGIVRRDRPARRPAGNPAYPPYVVDGKLEKVAVGQ